MNGYEIIGIIIVVFIVSMLIKRVKKKRANLVLKEELTTTQTEEQKSGEADFSKEELGDNDFETSNNASNSNSLHADYVKYLYDHPQTLVEFEFSNRTKTTVNVWIELACVEIELDDITEYKIVSHDKSFRIEFDANKKVIFYLQYSFGFKLYKRLISKNAKNELEWTLEYDGSDIN